MRDMRGFDGGDEKGELFSVCDAKRSFLKN